MRSLEELPEEIFNEIHDFFSVRDDKNSYKIIHYWEYDGTYFVVIEDYYKTICSVSLWKSSFKPYDVFISIDNIYTPNGEE